MGFKFSYLCDLLSSLESNRLRKASTSSKNKNPDIPTVTSWFKNHRKRIYGGETDILALLSCLFPEKRPDRVYRLQEPSLVKIIGRCLLLGASRKQDLDGWKASGGGDLGHCVELVMRQSENSVVEGNEVTIEEIDNALNRIASRSRHSGPKIRRKHAAVDVDGALASLFRRLPSRDAKWLTRMILKNYGPVVLPINCVLRSFHFLLPSLLLLQDSLEAAVQVLKSDPINSFPPDPDQTYLKTLSNIAMHSLAPAIGTKVGRPGFDKARSIKHCCRLAERRQMGIERKYDGEYCQIHVDLDRAQNCIQIFSKSGKESTSDKLGIHEALRRSLRIGRKDCKFSKQCILEGELLVWSDKQKDILQFHELRKHITRAGKLIGAENDSPPDDYEHLMIMFFDILLIDDNRCLLKPYNERRKLLRETIKTRAGHADIAERKYINFASLDAQERLTRAFAEAIAKGWEGFVLKGCDDPYITILQSSTYRGRWIKLKKDYMPGLGDTADFAIVGARYDAKDAHKLGNVRPPFWTSFHVGCLTDDNRRAVNCNARPEFRIVDVLNHNNLSEADIRTLNQYGQFQGCDFDCETVPFSIRNDQDELRAANVLFKSPFVVEMTGSGFDKPHNVNYFQLRFPRVLKIHFDRTFEDATTFGELQQMAENSLLSPEDDILQEIDAWAQKLKKANGKSEYIMDSSQKSTTSGIITPSPSLRKRRFSEFPENSSNQRLLPGNIRQAEAEPRTESRQKKAKTPELGLDSGSRDAANRDVTRHETPRAKRLKSTNHKKPHVSIFSDSSRRSTSPDVISTQGSRGCLTDVLNLGTQRKTQREIYIADGANCAQEDFVSENTPRLGQYAKMNIDEQQFTTNEETSVCREAPSPNRTDTSQLQSSVSVCATTSRRPDVTAAQEALDSSPHISPRDKSSSKFPMLIGRFLFKNPDHQFQSVISKIPVSATFSVNHFLDSVFSRWKEGNASSSVDGQQPAIGIVLVDYSEIFAMDTIADIDAVGKRLAELQQSATKETDPGQGQENPSSKWPEKGKIFFLHWGALSRDASVNPPRKLTWGKVAKRSFAGCVIWGYGGPRGYQLPETGDSHHKAENQGTAHDKEDGEYSFGYDIWGGFNWREVISLRGFDMEF